MWGEGFFEDEEVFVWGDGDWGVAVFVEVRG